MKNIDELLLQLNPNVDWEKLNYDYPKYNGLVYSSNEELQASKHLLIINLGDKSVKYYYQGNPQEISDTLKTQLLNAAKR
jgi:hypothetical protein